MQRQDSVTDIAQSASQTQADLDLAAFVALADNIQEIIIAADELDALINPPINPPSAAISDDSNNPADISSAMVLAPAAVGPLVSSSSSSSLSSSSSSSAESANNSCNINLCCNINAFCLLPYVPSLANAAKDAASDALSLYQAGNKSALLLYTATGIAFLAAFELSGQSTTENFREFTKIIRNRKTPSDWPALPSRTKIFIVTSAAIAMAGWCAFSESAQAYDFVGAIGTDYKITTNNIMKITWTSLTIGATVGSGITKLLTDNYETWKVMWRLSSGKSSPYANKVLTLSVGGVFAVLKSLHDSVQAYSVVKTIFHIQSGGAKFVLGVACLTDLASNYCFSGLAVMNQMDDMFGYIQRRKFEPTKIAAFIFSLALAIFLSYVKRTLNMGFYKDLATQDFGMKQDTIPEPAYEILSWLIVVSEVMLVTASLNPQMMNWFASTYEKISRLLGYMTKPCRNPTAAGDYPAAVMSSDIDPTYSPKAPLLGDDAERAERGEMPSASTGGLFAPRRTESPSEASADTELDIPRQRRWSGCPPCTLI